MKQIPVWFDCDTGVDDAVALMALHALDEIDLVAISCCCGNTTLENVCRNNYRLLNLMDADYPVYKGAEKALFQPFTPSTAFHGEDGLGGIDLPDPEAPVLHDEKMWDALYAAAKRYPGELRLIVTGPLTNAAIALTKYPELKTLLHSVLIMGGSASFGNVTTAAEFNIHADPEAAQIVFQSGLHIVMCGLDVTMKAVLTPADWTELADSGCKCGRYIGPMLQGAWRVLGSIGMAGVPMHDSCPVLYLVHPELFTAEEAGVFVETRGTVTLGKTVTDLRSDKKFGVQNTTVVLDVDRNIFIDILKDCIKKI